MESNELIRDLKCIARYHVPGTEMRKDVDNVVERAVSLLETQQARIAELEAELKEEMYRHDRVQDFEVAEAQELAKLRQERRWIPVEERLPDVELLREVGKTKNGYVLRTCKSNPVFVIYNGKYGVAEYYEVQAVHASGEEHVITYSWVKDEKIVLVDRWMYPPEEVD